MIKDIAKGLIVIFSMDFCFINPKYLDELLQIQCMWNNGMQNTWY